MNRIQARAHARAGLLGNPSDVYEGKAIAFAMANFSARVTLEASDRFSIERGPADALEFRSLREQVERLEERGCYDGIRLLRAAIRRFTEHSPELRDRDDDDPILRFSMRYETEIPRQVGLAGSSAIITAALRALAQWFEVTIPPAELAELALAAETEDLGITAGPMDRVIQAYDGLLSMDFSEPRGPDSYRRLEPKLLPPLFVAWDPNVGKASGRVHGDVRSRWLRGDPEVRAAIATFPRLVEEGLRCLESGDAAGFRSCVDANFDTRASIWALSDRDHAMVKLGRDRGAAVKFCGSGGAVVGVLRDEQDRESLEAGYRAASFGVLDPEIAPGIEEAEHT